MWDDVLSGEIGVGQRPTADVERLLGSRACRVGRFFVRLGDYPDRVLRLAIMPLVAVYRLIRRWASGLLPSLVKITGRLIPARVRRRVVAMLASYLRN